MSQTLTLSERPALSQRPAMYQRSACTSRSRLTPRGRVVVVVLVAIVSFGLFSLLQLASSAIAADPGDGTTVPTSEWVVQPGESLWDIAQTVEPETDPRDTVARIVQLNDLPDSGVVAGRTLLIPV